MGGNVLGAPGKNTLSIPGNHGSTLLDILADTAIAGILGAQRRQGIKPGLAQQIGYGGTPAPTGNIGNCTGQIAAIYYVHDTPPTGE
jgi:hypothetical protein